MRDEYDVIVVRAGPGGSTAARIAAEECDVLLIGKWQETGEPVRCAEGVLKQASTFSVRTFLVRFGASSNACWTTVALR